MQDRPYSSTRYSYNIEGKTSKVTLDYDLINERTMIIQLKTVQKPPFVFQVYAPDSS